MILCGDPRRLTRPALPAAPSPTARCASRLLLWLLVLVLVTVGSGEGCTAKTGELWLEGNWACQGPNYFCAKFPVPGCWSKLFKAAAPTHGPYYYPSNLTSTCSDDAVQGATVIEPAISRDSAANSGQIHKPHSKEWPVFCTPSVTVIGSPRTGSHSLTHTLSRDPLYRTKMGMRDGESSF